MAGANMDEQRRLRSALYKPLLALRANNAQKSSSFS